MKKLCLTKKAREERRKEELRRARIGKVKTNGLEVLKVVGSAAVIISLANAATNYIVGKNIAKTLGAIKEEELLFNEQSNEEELDEKELEEEYDEE